MLKKFLKGSQAPDPQSKPKESEEILEEQIDAGIKEFKRSNRNLFVSAFTAGLEIGFSVLLMGTLYSLFVGKVSPESMSLLLAISYPIGFIFVIIGRSELFTEHTALALLPVLNGSVTLRNLLILWTIVYVGNIIGGLLFTLLLVQIGPSVGFIQVDSFYHLAKKMVDYDWNTILFSALLAGWMMGLLGWLVTSSKETVSRIFVIILITSVIGLAGLHHCIVGSIEVLAGLITSDKISMLDYVKFQTWATIGNVLGGTIFVAVLKFGQIRI
ncbi:formate/nitrite transporter family protein [Algoriphagus sediminis]|uniref:Formate/nitrite transporter family protein n=1 Tax=Algoriphagus sediminis TaxID=3057113 RepID=A0ABT7YFC4_9BACT|nr:formate/nitrite transporter family protein [Algoriphagus sediminis]MDN3205224.1 formate/nitrite transporter family protein [Algoriphagus sediminis]